MIHEKISSLVWMGAMIEWIESGDRISLVSDGKLLARIAKDRDGWFMVKAGQRIPVPSADLERVRAELREDGERQLQRAAIGRR